MPGEIFVTLPPYSDSIIYGRISFEDSPEIVYFPSQAQPKSIQLSNMQINGSGEAFGIILSKPKESYGGVSGSNEKNVTIGLVYNKNESGFQGNELLRLALEKSTGSECAIQIITDLINQYEETKPIDMSCMFSFVICDPGSAWILNIVGKLWAAEKIDAQFRSVSSELCVGTKIDKCSENLKEECKSLALWDGASDFSFKSIIGTEHKNESICYDKQNLDKKFTVQTMFDVLRNHNGKENTKSSHVSVLNLNGICVNWFTGTSTKESVFKPFVFTSSARISPLTKVKVGEDDTILNKLHSQRNWKMVGELLQSLEKTCVKEVDTYIAENPKALSQELDDLMKDCVEAEVKFYR
ncbi:secernin-3 [Culicoides brevitarsis]|uniref:secernin-3 n=1 Tax=Culicoides brevitarsis TaxID=469753 RepID=UPI00307BB548